MCIYHETETSERENITAGLPIEASSWSPGDDGNQVLCVSHEAETETVREGTLAMDCINCAASFSVCVLIDEKRYPLLRANGKTSSMDSIMSDQVSGQMAQTERKGSNRLGLKQYW